MRKKFVDKIKYSQKHLFSNDMKICFANMERFKSCWWRWRTFALFIFFFFIRIHWITNKSNLVYTQKEILEEIQQFRFQHRDVYSNAFYKSIITRGISALRFHFQVFLYFSALLGVLSYRKYSLNYNALKYLRLFFNVSTGPTIGETFNWLDTFITAKAASSKGQW